MFDRFTERARRVLVVAQQESWALGHDHISDEHLVLGLLAQPDCVGARALAEAGVDLDDAWQRVRRAAGPRPTQTSGYRPLTPQAKLTLEHTLRATLRLRHQHLGTGHLLLALIREDVEGPATALFAPGTDPAELRRSLEAILVGNGAENAVEIAVPVSDEAGVSVLDDQRTGLDSRLAALAAAKDAALDRGDLQAAAAFRAQERELLRQQREGGAAPGPADTGPDA